MSSASASTAPAEKTATPANTSPDPAPAASAGASAKGPAPTVVAKPQAKREAGPVTTSHSAPPVGVSGGGDFVMSIPMLVLLGAAGLGVLVLIVVMLARSKST